MSRYPLMILCFCTLAVITILYLRPESALRFEAGLSRLMPEEALAALDAEAENGPLNRNLALMQAELALQAGAVETAQAALLRLRETDPFAAAPLDTQAELARMTGDLAQAARYLEEAQRLAPSPERRRELLLLYRQLRDAPAQSSLLRQVAPEELSRVERMQLIRLMIAARDFEALEQLLVELSRLPWPESAAPRERLIELLLESGRPELAAQSAADWFAQDERAQDVLVMAVRVMLGRGYVDRAYQVARMSLSTRPDTGHVLIAPFARSGHGAVARQLQEAWFSAGQPLTEAGWLTLAELAEMTGDLRGLRLALAAPGTDLPSKATLGRVLLQFLRYQGARSLSPYRQLLTGPLLDEAPLVAGAWMADQQSPAAAQRYLAAAAARPMTDWDRQIWLAVAAQLRGGPAYRALLVEPLGDAGLRTALNHSVSPQVAAPSP